MLLPLWYWQKAGKIMNSWVSWTMGKLSFLSKRRPNIHREAAIFRDRGEASTDLLEADPTTHGQEELDNVQRLNAHWWKCEASGPALLGGPEPSLGLFSHPSPRCTPERLEEGLRRCPLWSRCGGRSSSGWRKAQTRRSSSVYGPYEMKSCHRTAIEVPSVSFLNEICIEMYYHTEECRITVQLNEFHKINTTV